MRGLLTALSAALLTPALAGAAPVVEETVDGVVNWTARTIEVVGVGAPVILSHTGAVTPRDPYEAARADARSRVSRQVSALRVDARLAADVPAFDDLRASIVQNLRSAPPLHFSDGTVHLRSTASFAWGAAHAGAPVPPAKNAPTGLVVRLASPLKPRLRLTLVVGAERIDAGLPGDGLGGGGVRWMSRADAADARAAAGPRPLEFTATLGPEVGALVAPPAMLGLLKNGIAGPMVVVLP